MKVLYDVDVLPIGKYKGKTIAEVIEIDPTYIKHFNGGYKDSNHTSSSDKYAIADITLESIKK